MLAALVFVAVFIILISSYKIVAPAPGGGNQPAAAAIAIGQPAGEAPPVCTPGTVYTVDVSEAEARTGMLRCYTTDSVSGLQSAGPDAQKEGCTYAAPDVCAVRYCPPASYLREGSACIPMETCDPFIGGDACLRANVQNAMQVEQAANILASRLVADKAATRVHIDESEVSLAAQLSESGRAAVVAVIEATAEAFSNEHIDASAIRSLADTVRNADHAPRGPVAQISCQPKSLEPGMSVGVAYGCANSTKSSGTGFNTEGRLWGATEIAVPASMQNGGATYSLTCSDGETEVTASCDIEVRKPLVLVASQSADADGMPAIAWLTRGVHSCDFSSDNADVAYVLDGTPEESGVVALPPVEDATAVVLRCATAGGFLREARVTIEPIR